MRRRTAVLAALPLIFAAACGTAQKSDTGAGPTGGSGIKVTGQADQKPTVTFPAGKPRLTSSSEKVVEGKGEPVKDGDVLTAKVTVYNWDGKDNKSPGSDYDQGKSEFVTVNPQLPKALHEALVGAKPGGRVLAVIAKDNLTPDQLAAAKQQGTDFDTTSQVLVVDVISAATKAAHGSATDPGIEGVKLVNPGDDKAPTLTTKTTAKPPKGLVVKTVIKGTGPKVTADQMVLAHYTGKIWGTDKQFDSSWERGEPATFPLNQVVKGWSQGLTGVPVGSRVVITIPPELGYGKEGNPQGGIKGTDTIVFVVDVLGAA
ncbi:FKBP-type peptidyl-prolyl cis-trans isomerase [Microtetraspora sp. NBRC 16547]|uniref:FKBP-type peptidyl-prolyl cis-trans isomerase n=1 Tax=Microtetraspora sp. NBRC 16547 TaxID=3030993 RepID=UPI0024A3722F|nr:FKBP-type peptidyl-prolyl cis-trans isomerase [Microtetraspora sp. NBRC 16547]GLW99672.1 peptidylprolyl isomerase [Microtetraspora sp. NBRC 16547]